MPSTYTTLLRLEKQATGENNNTWGTRFNSNFADLVDEAIAGSTTVSVSSATVSLTANQGATDTSRPAMLLLAGTLTSSIDVVVPSATKAWIVRNGSSGSFSITLKAAGGSGYAVPQGETRIVWCDGTSVRTLSETGYLTSTSAYAAFVELSTDETITGSKIFTSLANFQGSVSVGGAFTQSGAFTITGATSVSAATNFTTSVSVSVLDVSGVARSKAMVTITYAASVTIDFSLGNDFIVSLTGNIAFVTATNVRPGQCGTLYLSQDGTGSRTGSWVLMFNFPSSTAPTLSTAASTTDMIAYNIRTSTEIDCVINKNMG